jgi:hypothetical protein
MAGTIILNLICGLVFLIPLVFVMPDQETLFNLASGQPLPYIIHKAVGHSGGAFALLIPLLVLGLFCGTGCTTAASRCTWAFARDGAIPGAKWWKVVNTKLDVPLNAMMLSMVVQLLLGLIYFGSSAAFNAFSGIGVICLTLSYACPIAVSVIDGRNLIANGSFNFGKLGAACNIIALCMGLLDPPRIFSLTRSRLVHPCHSSFLYADLPSRHCRQYELRPCRVLRFLRHRHRLVFRLGQGELPGPTHKRGVRVCGEESQHSEQPEERRCATRGWPSCILKKKRKRKETVDDWSRGREDV